MILLLDTSTGECRLTIVKDEKSFDYVWQADRTLARDLLGYLRDRLAEHDASFGDVTAIGVLRGPGSFTGLRIGMTVMNTLAHELGVPIVGSDGDDWRERALTRIENHENDQVVMPEYGSEAHITLPKK